MRSRRRSERAKSSCNVLAKEIIDASDALPRASRIPLLISLKTRALRARCECEALVALRFLEGELILAGEAGHAKRISAEIKKLEEHPKVRRMQSEPIPQAVDAIIEQIVTEAGRKKD